MQRWAEGGLSHGPSHARGIRIDAVVVVIGIVVIVVIGVVGRPPSFRCSPSSGPSRLPHHSSLQPSPTGIDNTA